MSVQSTPRDYRQSEAYRRSNRLRADGRPVWPLLTEDLPSHFSASPVAGRAAGATR